MLHTISPLYLPRAPPDGSDDNEDPMSPLPVPPPTPLLAPLPATPPPFTPQNSSSVSTRVASLSPCLRMSWIPSLTFSSRVSLSPAARHPRGRCRSATGC